MQMFGLFQNASCDSRMNITEAVLHESFSHLSKARLHPFFGSAVVNACVSLDEAICSQD